MDKMIANLESSIPKNSEDEERIAQEIATLKNKKKFLITNPNVLVKLKSTKEQRAPRRKKVKGTSTPVIEIDLGVSSQGVTKKTTNKTKPSSGSSITREKSAAFSLQIKEEIPFNHNELIQLVVAHVEVSPLTAALSRKPILPLIPTPRHPTASIIAQSVTLFPAVYGVSAVEDAEHNAFVQNNESTSSAPIILPNIINDKTNERDGMYFDSVHSNSAFHPILPTLEPNIGDVKRPFRVAAFGH
eukprot:TRINITY_DN5079_c0_g1_i1.p1 TRINITY_DN5079_c0_g1~~TRINITY_DN5079_c0_g1_i1.p1  ORF type:complete len:244 (+),score=48.99 TRINITY_DN5079_c0_g1_i1:110-841(+)